MFLDSCNFLGAVDKTDSFWVKFSAVDLVIIYLADVYELKMST